MNEHLHHARSAPKHTPAEQPGRSAGRGRANAWPRRRLPPHYASDVVAITNLAVTAGRSLDRAAGRSVDRSRDIGRRPHRRAKILTKCRDHRFGDSPHSIRDRANGSLAHGIKRPSRSCPQPGRHKQWLMLIAGIAHSYRAVGRHWRRVKRSNRCHADRQPREQPRTGQRKCSWRRGQDRARRRRL